MFLREFTQDPMVYMEVVLENEYRLPACFEPDDAIVDVGAHIGCFALACIQRGARDLLCYEPDRDNYRLLVQNTEPYRDRVRAIWQAVWRSDRKEVVRCYAWQAPGGTAMSQTWPLEAGLEDGVDVESVGLDDILKQLGRVRLLKLDCEGSEYPALFTSKELGRVQEIVLESHELIGFDEWAGRCNSYGLRAYLEGQGFVVEVAANVRCPQINHHVFARSFNPPPAR